MSNEPNYNGIVPNDDNTYEANGNKEQFEDFYSDSNPNEESSPVQNSVQENVVGTPNQSVGYDNAYQSEDPYAVQQNNMAPAEHYRQDNNGYYAYDQNNQQSYYDYNYENQYQYNYQPMYEMKKEKPPRYGVALTSMILGITSLVLLVLSCCCGVFFFVTWLPSLIGIILAFVSFSGGNKSGFAITGLITNITAFLMSVAMIIIFIIALSTVGSADYLYEFYPYM